MTATVGTEANLEIARKLAAGDSGTFNALYRKHHGAMIRIATAILGNRAAAEEVAQDSWIAVLENIGTFQGQATLASWIFTILVNNARTRASRDSRTLSLQAQIELDQSGGTTDADEFNEQGAWKSVPALWTDLTPERAVQGQQILEHVMLAIDTLPPVQRSVLILHGQQGLGSEAICEILNLTPGNMRQLLHRARYKVRKLLGPILS